MSLLLSAEEFGRARVALGSGEVTPELYVWLGRLVAVTQASRALAPSPLPGGRWDDPDAVSETVQAWLEESLLRGGLHMAFDRCLTPRSLSRYLERALRNWLVGRSRRATGPRLLERAGALMSSDADFVLVHEASTPSERWWALAVWTNPAFFAGSDEVLIAHAWALGDFALLRYASSDRADPVLSTPDLRHFLSGLLQGVGAAISGRHIDTVFRARFAYAYAVPGVPLEAALGVEGRDSPLEAVEIADSARCALAVLTRRQLVVLRERPETTLEVLATQLAVSRGTIDNEYRRAVLIVREASPSDEYFPTVLERLLEMASEERQ